MPRTISSPAAVFQSTHPVRGGTSICAWVRRVSIFQSTHPVRGGTSKCSIQTVPVDISIHPPREGWDTSGASPFIKRTLFQSTHPVRGGTSWADTLTGFCLYFNPPTP